MEHKTHSARNLPGPLAQATSPARPDAPAASAPAAQKSPRGRPARQAVLPALRFQKEMPPGFLAQRTRARFQQSQEHGRIPQPRSHVRDQPRQRTRGTAHAPPHSTPLVSPQVPLNSSWEALQTTDDAPKLPGHWPATPTHLPNTPRRDLSAPHVSSHSRGVSRKPRETASRGASLRPPSP